MTSRSLAAAVLQLLLAPLLTAGAVATVHERDAVATAWLALLDSAKHEDAWSEFPESRRACSTLAGFEAHMAERVSLGPVRSRHLTKVREKKRLDKLPRVPGRRYAELVYSVVFHSGASGTETLLLMPVGETSWQVGRYCLHATKASDDR